MLREAKGVPRQQRDTGIGELSFRPVPEEEFVAAPAAVMMLSLQQVSDRLLKSAVARITETTQHPRRIRRAAGVERAAGCQPKPTILSPPLEDEPEPALDGLVSASHAQFVEDQQ